MGAWGYKPFENDAALDWLFKVEDHVDKALTNALRPMQKISDHAPFWPALPRGFHRWNKRKKRQWYKTWKKRRRYRKKSEKPRVLRHVMTGSWQSEGFAAATFVIANEVLWRHRSWKKGPDYLNLATKSKLVLERLLDDKPNVRSWRRPASYVVSVKKYLTRANEVVEQLKQEEQKLYRRHLRRAKAMTKRRRNSFWKDAERGYRFVRLGKKKKKVGVGLHPLFKKALEEIEGREMPAPKWRPRPMRRRARK